MQFLYMARRDKSAVELLGVFANEQNNSMPFRVNALSTLSLQPDQHFALENFYADKKMMWELIVEDFEGFQDFRDKLEKRRYDNLPRSATPKLFQGTKPLKSISQNKPKIMLQRKKFFDN